MLAMMMVVIMDTAGGRGGEGGGGGGGVADGCRGLLLSKHGWRTPAGAWTANKSTWPCVKGLSQHHQQSLPLLSRPLTRPVTCPPLPAPAHGQRQIAMSANLKDAHC